MFWTGKENNIVDKYIWEMIVLDGVIQCNVATLTSGQEN